MRDGKTLTSSNLWQGKDLGFMEMFPEGLLLDQCGSREAAYKLERDAELLRKSFMTDYSLLGIMYPASDDGCHCDAKHPPKFPIILKAESGKLRMAVGIIDYIERE